MKTFFRILARTIAALFVILFILTLPVVILVVNIEGQLLDSKIYKEALTREKVYEALPALVGQALSAGATVNPCENNLVACGAEGRSPELQACMEEALGASVYADLAQNRRIPTEAESGQIIPCFDRFGWPDTSPSGGPPEFMKNLSASDWETILRSLISPSEMQAMTEEALDGIFAFLNGEAESATLSLGPIKTSLAGPGGLMVVETLIKAQPPCTLEQIASMAATIAASGELIFCDPGNEMIATLQPIFQEQLIEVSAALPDNAILIEPITTPETDPRPGLNTIRTVSRLSWLIPLVLLLGITIFAVRDLQSWLRWWGIPVLAGGLLSLIISLLLTSLYGFFITRYAAPEVPANLSPEIAKMGFGLGREVLRLLGLRLALFSTILGAIGAGMFAGSLFVAKKLSTQEG